ncbi:manganese efflux pump MntP family protein [bacterium]|nr:MAG: manganese efflux pump MntP family protein [bacterium]
MNFGSIAALAVGVSMDATAVAATRGLAARRITARDVLVVAVFFGGSQALMPLAGYALGRVAGPFVAAWDHWIAFAALGGIGAKMLWEAYQDDATGAPDDDARGSGLFGFKVMLVLAVATSIDAFAVGITLPLLDAPLGLSIATIGTVTAVLSAAGLFLGRRFGALLGKRLDVFGGLVLIGLGAKVLYDHLAAG